MTVYKLVKLDEHPGPIEYVGNYLNYWQEEAGVKFAHVEVGFVPIDVSPELAIAAPDLLEALEAMLTRYATGYNEHDPEAEKARAAIRKAKELE